MACSGRCWDSMHSLKIDFLGYVLWFFTTITEGVGGRYHDIVIGGGMPHSDHEWGEGAWLGGCTLHYLKIDFLGYVLWSFTTIMEGVRVLP